jgi:hypothetical protein
MTTHTISRCQNTLHTSNMDGGCSLKPAVASTMTLQHHSGSDLAPQKSRSAPHLHRPMSVRVDPYGHSHHLKLPKHCVYIQYGCGVQSEACCSLNHDITTSLELRSTLKSPKSTSSCMLWCPSTLLACYDVC